MFYYEVAPNRIIRAGSDSFTFSSDSDLPVGGLVEVEIGRKLHIGVILSKAATKPEYDTKPIKRTLEDNPLPTHLIELSRWMATHYATPLPTVLQTVLPSGIGKKRRTKSTNTTPVVERERTQIVLTDDQQRALQEINTMSTGSALLHGVTGSGKTAVYIETVSQTITAGKSAIILVPEIALTSQLVAEFAHHFSDIILTHSRQTEAERHLAWRDALISDTPRVIIGPRSALFMPVAELGCIIVDECHEPSYKQEQSPRYSGLEVSEKLLELTNGKGVFGSATPGIADYHRLSKEGRPIIAMERTAKNATPPSIELIDMTKRDNTSAHRFISKQLLARVTKTLSDGKQVLIFHNRRGSATITRCDKCSWQAGCPRCFIPLTLHADRYQLSCHLCGFSSPVPTSCPDCGSVSILHKGLGTKLIESEFRKLFPNKNIMRFDADSEKTETVEAQYNEIYRGDIDIIIGTQVVAKGLDLPHLRTVGIIQADAGLALPDYISSERTFQLLAQVIGRVGRSDHETSVIVQSYQPDHPAVQDGIKRDYADFYQRTVKLRQHTDFPPFTHLLKLTCIYKTEATAIRHAKKLAENISTTYAGATLLGPTPAFYERIRDTYRWQLIVKSPDRDLLIRIAEGLPRTHWQFELDPLSLL